MKVRLATREDIERFVDLANKPTIKAFVGEVDGQIVAMGGLAFSRGRWFAFCDLVDAGRHHKFGIARTAKRVLAEAKAQGIKYVYAEADPNEPGAVRWLARLGFERDPRTQYLYRWSA
jgi:N-acetylglutamate synthase-like GNAT family acetyltransferase